MHRLRTEARRLLALLKLVNTVTAADEVARACHAVTRQLKALGELRDVHVQLEHLRGLRQVHPEVKPVCRALRRRERRLAVADRRIRHRGRQRRRLAAVTRIVARIARDTDDATWQTAVSDSLREHAEAVLAARPAVAAGPSIHRARIALRDFRFAVELTGGFAQGLRPDHLESLHRCQSLMGDIHDLELMLAHIVAFGGDHPKMRARLEPLFRFFGRRRAELASEYRDAEEATFDPDHGLVVQVRQVFEEGEDERLKAEGGRRNERRSQTGGAPSGSFADARDDIENPRGPHGAERSPRPTGKRGSAGTPRPTLGSHENPQSAIPNSQSTESGRKAPPTAAKRGKPKAEGGKRRAQR